jgi:hypothetical protein
MLTLFIPSHHCFRAGKFKMWKKHDGKGRPVGDGSSRSEKHKSRWRCAFVSSSSRAFYLNLYLNSKKHSKVKATLDDETQRRKHFYGIDAGVKKMAGESKKSGADSKAKHGHKK